jgi:hypothetical protein
MLTNYEKASQIYYHCGHYITHHQQLKFLDCLERSGNYCALEILNPERRRQATEPTEPKPKNEPIPLTETNNNYVDIYTVGKILHDKTNLRSNWKILKDVLQMYPEEWMAIAGQCPQNQCVLTTIQSLLLHWSLSRGDRGATVGVLYDKFKENGRKGVGGILKAAL